jgi:HD-like signal output (HDOD) protein
LVGTVCPEWDLGEGERDGDMTSGARVQGKGYYAIVDDKALLSSDTLIDRFLATFRSSDYQPPTLPSTALELLELSRRTDVEFAQVLSLLERDSVVASQVLRKAQSAFYAGRNSVKSLHEAIVRLGLSTLRDMFMEVVFKNDVFRAPGYDEPMRNLQRHSTAVAYIARKVCERTGHAAQGQHAFLCGLLHDIGMAMCLIVLADQSRSARAAGDASVAAPPFDKVWPAIVRAHESSGGILGHLWRLPNEINVVVSSHHALNLTNKDVLPAAVRVADWIATDLGYQVPGEITALPREAMTTLGLSDATLVDIKMQARGVVARID